MTLGLFNVSLLAEVGRPSRALCAPGPRSPIRYSTLLRDVQFGNRSSPKRQSLPIPAPPRILDGESTMLQGPIGIAEKHRDEKAGERRLLSAIWLRLVELWIFAIIAGFVFIRIFGSHTVQRLLGRWAHRS